MEPYKYPGSSLIVPGSSGGGGGTSALVGIDIVRQDIPSQNQGGNSIIYEGYTPEACTLAEIVVFMKTLNTQGTYTATFTNVTTGNTVLGSASFNMQTLSANTWTALTLTGTTSDLTFAADDRFSVTFTSNDAAFDGSGIYFTMRFTSQTSYTPRAMDLLFSTTLTSTQATISTGTLPTGYRDLVIRGVLRSDRAFIGDNYQIILNGDQNSANYQYIRIFATGSVGFQRNATNLHRLIGYCVGNTAPAGAFNGFTLTVYNHERTDVMKSYSNYDTGQPTAGTSNNNSINYVGGQRRVTDAITTVGLELVTGDFLPGSSIAVYGLK